MIVNIDEPRDDPETRRFQGVIAGTFRTNGRDCPSSISMLMIESGFSANIAVSRCDAVFSISVFCHRWFKRKKPATFLNVAGQSRFSGYYQ